MSETTIPDKRSYEAPMVIELGEVIDLTDYDVSVRVP
jgi:hypothetical protein